MDLNDTDSMKSGKTAQRVQTGVLREVKVTEKDGFSVKDLVLIAILLAAGLVLKMTLGSMLSFGGMKPNFMIAMYCLAILLVRPKPLPAIIIGLITGAICQISAATPLVNLISEPCGALACSLLVMAPLQVGKLNLRPAVATFLGTCTSGYVFAAIVVVLTGQSPLMLLTYFSVMVLGTALLNTVLVSILFVPLSKAVGK